ncbi:MAG: NAD(P)-dependent oxidoreductase [Anaerolineales bacterium]
MKVSVLGTGLLGGAIAKRLLARGHQVTVWNRTRTKAERLVEEGAEVAAKPADAIGSSPLIVTVLLDGPVTRQVLLGDDGVLSLKGKTVVQMGTIAVQESCDLAEDVERLGGRYLEAPVLGSTPEAKEGALLMMVGGQDELFHELGPLLEDLSQEPLHLGSVGKAAALKLALNQLLLGLVGSFGLSLAMVREAEVDIEDFMAIVRGSSLHSPQFDKKLPRMVERDFADPHFPVTHILKDIELMLSQAGRHDLGTEALEGFRHIVERTLEMGYKEVDYSALYNGIHPPDGSG